MKKAKRLLPILFILSILFLLPLSSALAQTYSFSMDQQFVEVYWNNDGTASIDYLFVFTNDSWASKIDYVDVGIPNSHFDDNSIYADVDGVPVTDISRSGYQGSGTGVAVGLGSLSIQPGATGRVHVFIGTVRRVLYADSQSDDYASAVFSPTWFGSQYVKGSTHVRVTFHFPAGVQPDEPRWHEAPSGFPAEPATGFDDQGNIIYTWENPNANGYTQYKFGASFPLRVVPADAITKPSLLETLGLDSDAVIGLTFCFGFGAFMVISSIAAAKSASKRRMQYLSPKIAIEGHGIKRGLTAIEAAILLEQPLDKVMTMILFAVIKKNAATVLQRDPLKLDFSDPQPAGLLPYEIAFLNAFKETQAAKRRKALQTMSVDLVKEVSAKLKGFSRRETIAYYNEIVKRAWAQVEAAQTPEVKSEKFDEVMEWTMLDKNYSDRTRDVFRSGPVFVPRWWGSYDPVYRRSVSAPKPSFMPAPSTGTGTGLGGSLPHLPGSDFAASVVNGVSNFSSNVIGNLSSFTEGVTNKTNPPPVVTSSRSGGSRSGGGGCACACACAGCACACAGGGR